MAVQDLAVLQAQVSNRGVGGRAMLGTAGVHYLVRCHVCLSKDAT